MLSGQPFKSVCRFLKNKVKGSFLCLLLPYKRVPEALDGGVKDVGAPGVGDVGGRGPETPA